MTTDAAAPAGLLDEKTSAAATYRTAMTRTEKSAAYTKEIP
jgi:hypothetical protein